MYLVVKRIILLLNIKFSISQIMQKAWNKVQNINITLTFLCMALVNCRTCPNLFVQNDPVAYYLLNLRTRHVTESHFSSIVDFTCTIIGKSFSYVFLTEFEVNYHFIFRYLFLSDTFGFSLCRLFLDCRDRMHRHHDHE